MFIRFNLVFILLSSIATMLFTVLANGPAAGTPHFLGLQGSDGVIRQVPGHCGPEAHTENHPKYGEICIQNKMTEAEAKQLDSHSCLGQGNNGLLYSCQANFEWKRPACVDDKGNDKRPDGRAYNCRYVNGIIYIE